MSQRVHSHAFTSESLPSWSTNAVHVVANSCRSATDTNITKSLARRGSQNNKRALHEEEVAYKAIIGAFTGPLISFATTRTWDEVRQDLQPWSSDLHLHSTPSPQAHILRVSNLWCSRYLIEIFRKDSHNDAPADWCSKLEVQQALDALRGSAIAFHINSIQAGLGKNIETLLAASWVMVFVPETGVTATRIHGSIFINMLRHVRRNGPKESGTIRRMSFSFS